MKKLILLLLFIPVISFGQSIDQGGELTALRLSDDFSKPYRVLKTTFKSLDGFQSYYPGTEITLETILRYHLYTAIHINQNDNTLISMDLTKFKLKETSSEESITIETVNLIGDMFFGSSEVRAIQLKEKKSIKY
jgi:hypothetical protein